MAIFAEKSMSMDRKEFCEMLVRAREEAGVSKSEMCIKSKALLNQLLRIETAYNNFRLEKSLLYLSTIRKVIIIFKGHERNVLTDVEQFSEWLSTHREKTYSQQSLSDATGLSRGTITNIERNKNVVSIDTFLKIVDTLGYAITIEDLN